MKKVLALILALVLCVGILAGCQQTPAETSKPAETTKPAETQKPQETTQATEPAPTEYTFPAGATLDVYAGHAEALEGTELNKYIEAATGLDIQWLRAPGDGNITPLLTEKVTPSLAWGYYNANKVTYGRYGAFVNLWDYQDIMPNFFGYFNSEEYANFKEAYMPSENELYAAPVFLNGDIQRFGWIYREDIFKELNLEVPTDWESFYACLKAMKAKYPESYPFTMRNMTGNITGLTELAQQFGVDYRGNSPFSLDADGKFYAPFTTDEMREMLKKFDLLIKEELMDEACMGYDTAMWQQAFTSGHAFITHDKAFQLQNLEEAGKQANPNFSLSWFNNIPMVESDLPYQTRDKAATTYCWIITSNCADVELACRYLDWLYSPEGIEIMNWGVKGESYEIDADGNKKYKEGFDPTYMSRYQESGYIDFDATMLEYEAKTQEMILGTMEASKEGGFFAPPTLTLNDEEKSIRDTYQTGLLDEKNAWLQNFLLGKKDINDDAQWQAFKDALAAHHIDEVIKSYDTAYARYLEEKG